ncbi:hypothetical protein THRCLA_11066, partial [Thraustotheca clavata]
MIFITVVVLFLFSSLGAVFLFTCVDSSADGVLGRLRKVVVDDFPQFLSNAILRICGDRVHRSVVECTNYSLYEPNPLMQMVYLLLVCGGYGFFLFYGQPYIPNLFISSYHTICVLFLATASLCTFFQASTISPGLLNERTLRWHNHYEYDGVMYKKDTECTTCKVIKLARSKHCSVCNVCVPRFDHHCGWLNSCVGERNYKSFLAFIMTNAVFLMYGTYVLGAIIVSEVITLQLFQSKYVDQSTGEPADATYFIVFRYVMHIHPINTMLFFVCLVMGCALTCFSIFHLRLLLQNRTTNEYFKQRGSSK